MPGGGVEKGETVGGGARARAARRRSGVDAVRRAAAVRHLSPTSPPFPAITSPCSWCATGSSRACRRPIARSAEQRLLRRRRPAGRYHRAARGGASPRCWAARRGARHGEGRRHAATGSDAARRACLRSTGRGNRRLLGESRADARARSRTIARPPGRTEDSAEISALHARAFGPGRFARTAYRVREGTARLLALLPRLPDRRAHRLPPCASRRS